MTILMHLQLILISSQDTVHKFIKEKETKLERGSINRYHSSDYFYLIITDCPYGLTCNLGFERITSSYSLFLTERSTFHIFIC